MRERVRLNRRATSVHADTVAPNVLRIRTQNVAELVLHLSPGHLDLDKKVEIRMGNRTFFTFPSRR